MESNDKPANVLIEPQNRRRLKELAERHKRSMNGEVNWIIERAYDIEVPACPAGGRTGNTNAIQEP